MKTRNISFSQNIIDKVNNSVVSVVSKKKHFYIGHNDEASTETYCRRLLAQSGCDDNLLRPRV